MRVSIPIIAVLVAGLAACSAPSDPPPPSATARAFRWSHWGGSAGGDRYAPIAQITKTNVAGLEPAWTFHTGALAKGWNTSDKLTFEATPLYVDGTLYFDTATGQVFALDAATGKARWHYDAHVDPKGWYSELSSRGVSYWRDPQAAAGSPCAARLFVPTIDARLIALDAATGQPCADFGEHGQIRLATQLRDTHKNNYELTSPPVVADGTVITGISIGDNGSAAEALGVVRAFDARSGAPRWHWDPIVRTDASHPNRTPYPKWNGAANAWGVFSVDAQRHLVFIPTGSASPDLYGGERPGDDHWANSLVALDTRTGKRVWARQLVHHDTWDYDVAAQPMLITLHRHGRAIPAVVQLTKNGQAFVFDRTDGTPLFPITEKPVPTDGVPGEQLSPTQPYSSLPALIRQGPVKPSDAWGLTFWSRNACRRKIARLRSDGMFTPQTLQWQHRDAQLRRRQQLGRRRLEPGHADPVCQRQRPADGGATVAARRIQPPGQGRRRPGLGVRAAARHAVRHASPRPAGTVGRAVHRPAVGPAGGAGPGARAHRLEHAVGQQSRAGTLAVLVPQGRAQHGRPAGHAQRLAVHRRQHRRLPACL